MCLRTKKSKCTTTYSSGASCMKFTYCVLSVFPYSSLCKPACITKGMKWRSVTPIVAHVPFSIEDGEKRNICVYHVILFYLNVL